MEIFHVPTHDHQCTEPHRQGDVGRPLSLAWRDVQLWVAHHQHEHEGSKNNTPPSDQKDRIEEAIYENWYEHEHLLTLSSLSCTMNSQQALSFPYQTLLVDGDTTTGEEDIAVGERHIAVIEVSLRVEWEIDVLA